MMKTMLDLTYPITSMFSGAGFNSSVCSVFKDRQIEVPQLATLGNPGLACLHTQHLPCPLPYPLVAGRVPR